jgi:uncharacterized protein YjaG (DUF416 family)
MTGQMCWLSNSVKDGETGLNLRLEPHHPWKIYTFFSSLAVRNYNISNGSKRWATYQKLLRAVWTVITTEEAKSSWKQK